MIFLTVGTQLPFDRLVKAIDQKELSDKYKMLAQIGNSEYTPKNFEASSFYTPSQIDDLMNEAELIVAHAGMGSVLTALKYKTPIIVMPRSAKLGEHRNEHQFATAKWIKDLKGVTVAHNEEELYDLVLSFNSESCETISEFANPELLDFLSNEINS